MTWYAWPLLALAAYPTGRRVVVALAASVARGRSRRGGTLRLDSPGARAVFKQRGEASERANLNAEIAWLEAKLRSQLGDDKRRITYADLLSASLRELDRCNREKGDA